MIRHGTRDGDVGRINMVEIEDISREKLNWLIEHVDEMFLDLEMCDNET